MTTANDCGRCASPLERDDLRCPICNASAPHTAMEDVERTAVEVLRCDGCGASVSYDVRARAPACAFCGSVMHGEVPDDPIEQTRFYLPFSVERPEAEAAYRGWLQGLGFTGQQLGDGSGSDPLFRLYAGRAYRFSERDAAGGSRLPALRSER